MMSAITQSIVSLAYTDPYFIEGINLCSKDQL